MAAGLSAIMLPAERATVATVIDRRAEPLLAARTPGNPSNEIETASSEDTKRPAQVPDSVETSSTEQPTELDPSGFEAANASESPPAINLPKRTETSTEPQLQSAGPITAPIFGSPFSVPNQYLAGGERLAALPPTAAPVEPVGPAYAPLDVPTVTSIPLPRERPGENGESAELAGDLFAGVNLPSAGTAHVVGFYTAGCIAGAQSLALRGRYWQVMRPSRNRYWGHPELIAFIERLAHNVAARSDWPGILIGDMAQPRGGPLPAGHASHQVGLDVDIWLKPMPREPYTLQQTETVPMASVVGADNKQLDRKVWQPEDATLIKIAAQQPDVERIFVNPVIKKELCRIKAVGDEAWMEKVRPWYGHDEHMHVRLRCPPGARECRAQPAVPTGDGCGKALEHWFKPGILATQQRLRTQPPVKRTTTMRVLPIECSMVLHAPAAASQVARH